jgi:hypothetical protein
VLTLATSCSDGLRQYASASNEFGENRWSIDAIQ